MSNRIGIIDLGTNTFHILIAESLPDGGINKLYSKKVPVKIGQGGISQGLILEDAIERAEKTFIHFREILDRFEVSNVKAIATSAFRNASNKQEVVDRLMEVSQIKVEVIDGLTEASFIHRGVSKAVHLDSKPSVIMDIGGGSVEFIICNQQEVLWSESFEIGGQRLMQKFHTKDPIPPSSRNELFKYLDLKLINLQKAAEKFNPHTLVGSSGTFDTLCEIYHKENNLSFSLEAKTEFDLPYSVFHEINEEIIAKDRAQRLEIPGMIMMRVDMIVVSCCLIEWVLKNLEIENIKVSTYAMKEGLLSHHLAGF